MKTKLPLTLLLSFSFYLLSSQVPQGFNYQAIARDGDGNLITDAFYIKVEIQNLAADTVFWIEEHNVTPNEYGLISFVVGQSGRIGGTETNFEDIDWISRPRYLRTSAKYPGPSYTVMGTTQIMSVPYSLVAKEVTGPVDKLGIKGTTTEMDEALFEVRNKDGQIIFAVYNQGVRIFVDDAAKGPKGGFAIGGFGTDKGTSQPYFIVKPDTVRIYINQSGKGPKGGFAIGGYGIDKTDPQNFLFISDDSIRMYIDKTASDKGVKGGFAIGGFGIDKDGVQKYLFVSGDSIRAYIDSTSTKGVKGGFAIGGFENTKAPGQEYLRVTRDSVRVYLDANPATKGVKGGFAIGGFDYTKGDEIQNYLNVTPDSTRVYVNEPGSEINNNGFSVRGRNPDTNIEGDYLNLSKYTSKIYSKSSFYNEKEYTSWNLLVDDILYGKLDTLKILKASFGKLLMTIPYTNVKDDAATFEVLTKEQAKGSQKRVVKIGAYNIGLGYGANNYFSTGLFNISIGYNHGCESSEFPNTGNNNVLIGSNTLESQSDKNILIGSGIMSGGSFNVILGIDAGMHNHTNDNIFIGHSAGANNSGSPLSNGNYNIFMGSNAGVGNTTGSLNIMIGKNAGHDNSTGTNNTIIGNNAGYSCQGYNNVFIGPHAGYGETGSEKLYIANTPLTPLIGGSFSPTPMVGINRMPTTYTLEVGGTIWANGATITAGAETWSDVRYKKDIIPIKDALSDILRIQGVKFNWKESDFPELNFPAGEQIGVIAQDIEKILPQLVYTGPDGYKSVSYEKLTPVLVEAVKEQQEQIESQNQKIEQLEKMVIEMRDKIASLSQ